MLAGAVMAGGQSRRMGFDKARLEWGGEPLWRRQVRLLDTAGARPTALVRRVDQTDFGHLCWRDLRTDAGPLAGLEAALIGARELDASKLAVAAVDMPYLTSGWYRWLLAGGPTGAAARHDGLFEPLAAIYPVAALPFVQARLDAGQFALQGLLEELVARRLMAAPAVLPADLAQIRSVNTFGDCPSAAAPPGREPDLAR
jgi:molybdopterin-guanine dinucleotide biosynthesis protein A